jgi:molybdate transport system permease protein
MRAASCAATGSHGEPARSGAAPVRPPALPGRREGFESFALGSLVLVLFIGVPLAALVLDVRPDAWLAQLGSATALRALWLTLVTTAVSTVLCVAFGLPLAYLLARFEFRGKALVDTLVDLPVTIPPVVVGLALLLAFGRQGWVGRPLEGIGIHIAFSTVAVVMAQVAMASPFFVRAARAGFEAVDEQLERAAWALGASRLHAFRTVVIPLAMPSLLAGAVMCWARALSEFGATMMFAGNLPGRTQTLALAVMSAMESDLDTAVAVAALSLVLGIVALATLRILLRQRGARS